MKRIILTLFSLFYICIQVFSQDFIFLKKNGAKAEVSIESVSDEMIYYKKYGNKKGTVFSIPVQQVLKIQFEQGNIQYFDRNETKTENQNKDFQQYTLEEEIFSENTELIDTEQPGKKDKEFKMKLGLGLLGGVGFSTLQYQYQQESYDVGNTYRMGPAGGLMIEWEIARFLALQTSIWYKDKGDRINAGKYVSLWEFPENNPVVYSAEGDGYINKHLGYLEWSVMPMIGYTNVSNSFQVLLGAGVYAGYGISGKEKIDMSVDYYLNGEFDETEVIQRTNDVVFTLEPIIEEKLENELYFNRIDYGFIFGLHVKPRPFMCCLDVSWGKGHVLSSSLEELLSFGEIDHKVTNFTVTLAIGYTL